MFLNERLVFHFSEPLDRTSVTASSVEIIARNEERTAARGRLRVSGRTLVFEPAPVLTFELDDGGYLPDTTYDVQLAGFPRPDGLRGRGGAPLLESCAWDFHTVAVTEPRAGFVFEDATLDRGLALVLRSDSIAPGDPIVFEGEEPLDPSTLFAGDFELRRKMSEFAVPGEPGPLGPPIPLRARLTDNRDRRASGEPGQTTRVELQPPRLEPGSRYWLQVDPTYMRLRDFGGHPILALNRDGGRELEVEVVPIESAAGTYLEYTETFIDDVMRSTEQVPRADGTLAWGSSGRAEVRWPAAAGSGVDGAVVLGENEMAFDLQTTSLRLPARATCKLNAVSGLVVLRAQGRMDIEGRLIRDAGAEPFHPDRLFEAGETLSEWLVRARRADTDCTVLIAGGDLVISGRVEVDGPLLLVAGGRIRVPGQHNLAAPHAAKLGDGPVLYARPRRGNQAVDACPLVLDLATENILAVPLTYAVRSTPIPRSGAAARWHPAPRVGGHAGAGTVLVRYLGERERSAGGAEEVEVDDPAALLDSPTLRLELRLDVVPGEVWDPPWVDSIQVRWDPEGG